VTHRGCEGKVGRLQGADRRVAGRRRRSSCCCVVARTVAAADTRRDEGTELVCCRLLLVNVLQPKTDKDQISASSSL
jgi:hypothetical protein